MQFLTKKNMKIRSQRNAVVIGSGPNGLAAAIVLAQQNWSVQLIEGKETVGGGVRSAELTLPGFTHDICSAIYPLSLASPFIRSLPLEDFGLEWIHPSIPVAHPLDNGSAVILEHTLDETIRRLGNDGKRYHNLVKPFVDNWENLVEDLLGPLPVPPKHPFLLVRFGIQAIRSAQELANHIFRGEEARAVFAGNAAHSILPLSHFGTAAAGLLLGIFAHTVGWPMVRGGSQNLSDAMLAYFKSLGGEVITGMQITHLGQIPPASAILFDVTPQGLIKIAGEQLPSGYRSRLERFRYGSGVFKIDYALTEPVPWQAPEISLAATVHIGGTMEEIAASELDAWRGKHAEKPFVLFVQQSNFDPSRAPQGKHTAWAYCHVPHGSTIDMTSRIEAQIERFAPGFRDTILARHTLNAQEIESYNPNYIGGDIIGGVQDLRQQYFRPTISMTPYRTPLDGIFLCSSSTPPGGGVHGMAGFHAAQTVMRTINR